MYLLQLKIPHGFKQKTSRWSITIPVREDEQRKELVKILSTQLKDLEMEISAREEKISRKPKDPAKKTARRTQIKKELQKLFSHRDRIRNTINGLN